jgi:hypothetical protein
VRETVLEMAGSMSSNLRSKASFISSVGSGPKRATPLLTLNRRGTEPQLKLNRERLNR